MVFSIVNMFESYFDFVFVNVSEIRFIRLYNIKFNFGKLRRWQQP